MFKTSEIETSNNKPDSLQNELFSVFKDNMLRREIASLKADGFSGENLIEGISFIEESPEALGIFPPIKREEESGFLIGCYNPSILLRHLTSLNGIEISELENTMRSFEFSGEGFLGKDEKLLDVLVADNEFIESKGLTHQELAYCLRYAEAIIESRWDFKKRHGYDSKDKNKFILNGQVFMAEIIQYLGPQSSPFRDGTSTTIDIMICNLQTEKSLFASGLHKDMIERYGFYEGKGSSYRLEPSDIIEVFELDSRKIS